MRKRTIMRRLAGAVLCGALMMALPALADDQKTVSKGVLIEGTDIGGMTADQVTEVISQKVAAASATQITVKVADQETTCSLADLGLTWSNKEVMDQILNLGATGNIVQRYKDQKDLQVENKNFDLTYAVDRAKTRAYVQTLEQYNSEPVNAKMYTTDELTPGIEGGTNGITVDAKKTVKAIRQAAAAWDGESPLAVDAVITSVEPEVTYEQLSMITDVLGSATTDYSASSAARAANVQNGCSKISGSLIQPGETFSVTNALVPFTAENGYEQAPSYEENRVVDSYGGGICQVSTTLYNAVLKAELEVTQRSNHTMVVSYVDLSKDAAIAEGVMDFCFYNNQETPVYIIGYCYGGQISFMVYGHETRPANRTLEFESRTLSTIEPSQAKIYANAGQAVGYINQTQSPHTGYTAELWKNIYIDGVLTDSVQVNSSSYTAVGTIYDVGVMTDNAALYSAMSTAIATGDITQVQGVIANAASYTNPQTETTAPETTQTGEAANPADPSGQTGGVNPDGTPVISIQ